MCTGPGCDCDEKNMDRILPHLMVVCQHWGQSCVLLVV
jgi:hypothetical protein